MKRILSIFLALVALAACHKTRVTTPESVDRPTTDFKDGFPEDVLKLNGYLSLSVEQTSKSLGGIFKTVSAFAVFRDPEKPLTQGFDRVNQTSSFLSTAASGVNMGVVSTGSTTIPWDHIEASYETVTFVPDSVPQTPRWYVQGNRTFPGFNAVIPRGYPSLVDSELLNDTASDILGYRINVHRFASNYDSVVVTFFSTANGTRFVFKGNAGTPSFFLTGQQVDQLWPIQSSPVDCRIHLFNYSHRLMNGKVYLFENVTRMKYRPGLKLAP